MLKKNILLLLCLGLFLINVPLARAATTGILPQATGAKSGCANASGSYDANYCGDYSVNDFVSLAIKVANWILGIVGSLTLAMFIYGGIMFLVSAGSSEAVGRAKKIIVAAVVGLIIVFSSYLIIKFVLDSMGVSVPGVTWTSSSAQLTNTK
jgi:hypothetical protein